MKAQAAHAQKISRKYTLNTVVWSEASRTVILTRKSAPESLSVLIFHEKGQAPVVSLSTPSVNADSARDMAELLRVAADFADQMDSDVVCPWGTKANAFFTEELFDRMVPARRA